MVQMHDNIVGIDSAVLMHPTVWKASGHVDAFNDPLIDNKVNILLPIPQENEIGFFINDLIGKQYVSDITLINMGDQTMVILEFSERPPSGTYLISVIINNEIITKKLLLE